MDSEAGATENATKISEFSAASEGPPSPVLKASRRRLHNSKKKKCKLPILSKEQVVLKHKADNGVYVFGSEPCSLSDDLENRLRKIEEVENCRMAMFNKLSDGGSTGRTLCDGADFSLPKQNPRLLEQKKSKPVEINSTSKTDNPICNAAVIPKLKFDVALGSVGFSTAAGKNIVLSETALKNSVKIFNEVLSDENEALKETVEDETSRSFQIEHVESFEKGNFLKTATKSLNISQTGDENDGDKLSFFKQMTQTEVRDEELLIAAKNAESNVINNQSSQNSIECAINNLEKAIELSTKSLEENINKLSAYENKKENLEPGNISTEPNSTESCVAKAFSNAGEQCEKILDVLFCATKLSDNSQQLDMSRISCENMEDCNTCCTYKNNLCTADSDHSLGFRKSEIIDAEDYVNRFMEVLERQEKLYNAFEKVCNYKKSRSGDAQFSVNEIEKQKCFLNDVRELVELFQLKVQCELETLEQQTHRDIDGVEKNQTQEDKICREKTDITCRKRSNDGLNDSPKKRIKTANKKKLKKAYIIDKHELTADWCKLNFGTSSDPNKLQKTKQTCDENSDVNTNIDTNVVESTTVSERTFECRRKDQEVLSNSASCKTNKVKGCDKIFIKTNRQMEIAVEGSDNFHIDINYQKQSATSRDAFKIGVGFKTASGKSMYATKTNLQKGHILLDSEADVFNSKDVVSLKGSRDCCTFKKENVGEVYRKAKVILKDVNFSVDSRKNEPRKLISETTNTDLMQIQGKDMAVSTDSFKKWKELFRDEDAVSCNSSEEPRNKQTLQLFDARSEYSTGFSTAGGKNIVVASANLKKSENIFKDVESFKNIKKIEPVSVNTDFYLDAEKDISGSKESVHKFLKVLKEDAELLNKNCDNDTKTIFANNFSEISNSKTGFSTASGKGISVSKGSLKKFEKLFQDESAINTENKENNSELSPSTFNETLSLGTCYLKSAEKKAVENTEDVFEDENLNREIRSRFQATVDRFSNPVDVKSGFSTAAGKNILVSTEAIKNFQNFFKDDTSSNNLQNSENQSSVTTSIFDGSSVESTNRKTECSLDECKSTIMLDSVYKRSETLLKKVTEINSNIEVSRRGKFSTDKVLSENLLHRKAAGQSSRRRLGIPPRKSYHAPINNENDYKNAMSIFKDILELKPDNCLSILNDEHKTPQKSTCKIFNSTPVRNSKSCSVIPKTPTLKSGVISNDSLQLYSSDITPIKQVSKLDLVGSESGIVFKETEEGSSILQLQKDLDEQCKVLRRKLKFFDEKRQAVEVQKNLLENPAIEHTRKRPGVLTIKKQLEGKVSLKNHVSNIKPGTEINLHPVDPLILDINPQNALQVHFDCLKTEGMENAPFITIPDGGVVIPSVQNTVGICEIQTAFKVTPGVEIRLIPTGWIKNHYRWIVWKLASLERSYPDKFKGCLSIENVMLQLKYRYDREIDNVERSALRLILEKDAASQKRMVLCISNIVKICDNNFELELTDGWYSVRTVIDAPLCYQIQRSRLIIGTKIITHGAELLNCMGCHPLEMPDNVCLKIMFNSTRRAAWDAKLGFQKFSGPLPILIKTVNCDGGTISSIRVYIARTYPLQFMEKQNGTKIFRNQKADELRAHEWDAMRSKKIEELQNQLQKDFEASNGQKISKNNIRDYKKKDIEKISCPQTLHELMESSNDPESFQEMLSPSQMSCLYQYQQTVNDKRKLSLSLKLSEYVNNMNLNKRDVTTIFQLMVLDTRESCIEEGTLLRIYDPTSEHLQMLKEDAIFTISNLTMNHQGQLIANSKTHYKHENMPAQAAFKSVLRKVVPISETADKSCKPPFDEFDTFGVVIKKFIGKEIQFLWLSDFTGRLLFIQILEGPDRIVLLGGLERGQCIAVSNLKWKEPFDSFGLAIADHHTVICAYPKQKALQEGLKLYSQQEPEVLNTVIIKCEERVENHTSKSVLEKIFGRNIRHTLDLLDASSADNTLTQAQINEIMCLIDVD